MQLLFPPKANIVEDVKEYKFMFSRYTDQKG